MTLFRPCIDLHQGKVKQIVGGSLNDSGATENFISQYDAEYYADLYKKHGLKGGHVIALGKDKKNHEQAICALRTYPNGLQYGGGVTAKNATEYLKAGASHVIVTSYLFKNGAFSWDRLDKIKRETGVDRLVLDLSCRRTKDGWYIATDRWQTVTSTAINEENLYEFAQHCDEFLIHAADVEGLQAGIDEELVTLIGKHSPVNATYAGGARSLEDLKKVQTLSDGNVDLTIGSALDIFGGSGVNLEECIGWNKQPAAEPA
ncbi:phosphoribosylformimino-5-aminoimidazole carboxamide ribotide isomerase [Marinomonas mediterranea]|uniref:phosphoribosylformimino-5-aminoimidazole carboxamide ribotide isomerase n=1 Tax=Marinomonas mediterranea TaxID=119864 RepID=UPI00234A6AC6|nr:phosphoribosylformimino-5-aminoimidazole carboxamide ribotide isomerase [Marinomonas mediterranea]WCN09782.1 phosphoribosylformimino-5-aminoimidazole carboxamide ribotide isomerase [Marinomonas mediterranea]